MRYVILLLATFCLYAEDSAQKSPATLMYEKVLSENAREVVQPFDGYWKALEATNAKVIKALEGIKADLNDSRKGSLSISDRAKAITELDEKIKEVKAGAINDMLVENKRKAGMPASAAVNEKAKAAASPVGKWERSDRGHSLIINEDGTFASGLGSPGKWTANDAALVLKFDNGASYMFTLPIKNGTLVGTDGIKPLTYSRISK